MDFDIIFPFLFMVLLFLYLIFEISLCCICPNTQYNENELDDINTEYKNNY